MQQITYEKRMHVTGKYSFVKTVARWREITNIVVFRLLLSSILFMAVQLSLNPEQAKMLLPLLQMAVSSAGSLEAQRHSELPFQPVFSSTPNSSMELDNSMSTFSMEELLTKAKKNTKSTDAQIELRVSFSCRFFSKL